MYRLSVDHMQFKYSFSLSKIIDFDGKLVFKPAAKSMIL
ncbi:hypothetical protein AsAng_0022380 [Aureispira anguillae]|uniref:Uncharacterized protein n=1 Tax=Aureispira anguillae TaxID=2864201 RepID=A0A915YEE1_9BACT|nr:hypothetical protein AsAng_0022380 [Aureispira anguillae]